MPVLDQFAEGTIMLPLRSGTPRLAASSASTANSTSTKRVSPTELLESELVTLQPVTETEPGKVCTKGTDWLTQLPVTEGELAERVTAVAEIALPLVDDTWNTGFARTASGIRIESRTTNLPPKKMDELAPGVRASIVVMGSEFQLGGTTSSSNASEVSDVFLAHARDGCDEYPTSISRMGMRAKAGSPG